ncbi:MAG: hypothetical protein GKR90_02605 [Pseudomonadales bacterium]|nr:hypothetical protein [Pseudomonadales bacterium]
MTEQETLVVSELHYVDPEAALSWLERVFGFRTRIVVRDDGDNFVFAESEVRHGQSVAVLPEMGEKNQSPLRVDGVNTQTVRVRSQVDVIEHCERARSLGATIVSEPEQFFFGDLTYFVADLEGHIWAFAQPIEGKAGPPPEGWSVEIPK